MVLYMRKGIVHEDIERKGKGSETSGLGEGATNKAPESAGGYGPDKDRRNGGKWGRRATDKHDSQTIPLLHRVQEPREIQGDIRRTSPSLDSYGCRVGANRLHKDEPPETDSGT